MRGTRFHLLIDSTSSIHTSSTASLSESITEYRRIHGRTYTQKTDYWGPNDERQNEGLDIAYMIDPQVLLCHTQH